MTRLELWRRSQNMTLDRLAKTLGSGFTAGVLSLMEGGRLRPSARQAVRLEEALGITVDELLASVSVADTLAAAAGRR